jgi:hypothetical protein
MVNDYAALSQNLLELAIGNRIANVKEHRMQDDTFGK